MDREVNSDLKATNEEEEYLKFLLLTGELTLQDFIIICLRLGYVSEKYYTTEAIAAILFLEQAEVKESLNRFLSVIVKNTENQSALFKDKIVERLMKYV